MASDQLVNSKLILDSLLELQRRGSSRAMEELEKLEPTLAEYLMENLSLIHLKLLAVGARPKETMRLQRRIEGIILIAVVSLRKAHYQLWQASVGGDLAPLDPAADGPTPSPPSSPETGPVA